MKSYITMAVVSLLCVSLNANAGSLTAATKASATLNKTCTIGASNVNFGTLNLAASNYTTYANGSFSVLCTKGTSYSILLTYGTPATNGYYQNGRPSTGLMTGATSGAHIAYGLQQQPINNSLPSWGITPYTSVGTGGIQNITVYGEVQLNAFGIPAYPTPDNYSDNVTATLTY
jgi:spore coat protein U-like protein